MLMLLHPHCLLLVDVDEVQSTFLITTQGLAEK